jgi:ATP-binding cassette subfamily C protein CydC
MKVWAYLYRLYRQQARWLILSFICLGVTWLSGAALLASSGWFIAACALAGVGLIANLNIFAPSTLIRGLAILRTVGRYAERVIGHEAILRVLKNLRVRAFNAVACRPARFIDSRRLSDLIHRLIADVETLDAIPLRILGPMFAALMTLAGCVWVGALWGDTLIAVVIGASGLSVLGVSVVLAKQGQKRGAAVVHARAAQKIAVVDHLGGLAELISNHKQHESAQNLAQLDDLQTHRFNAQEQMASLGEHGVQAITALTTIAVIAIAWPNFEAPIIALLALMTIGLNEALGALPGALWRTGEAKAAAERLMDLENIEQNDAMESTTSSHVFRKDIAREKGSNRASQPFNASDEVYAPNVESLESHSMGQTTLGPVEIIDLMCQRQPGKRYPLNVTLKPGLPLVIYGRSGTGKTSLLETLAGELTARQGGVWLDGTDLLMLPDSTRYQKITLLAQSDSLLNMTIRQFLSLGLDNVPDVTLLAALQCVDLHETLSQTEEGLDYSLGVRGSHVSGGQARRLQLAALLIKEPALVLLDEPFRGLQAELVQDLIQGIEPWLLKRCSIIVTHDPKSLPAHWPRLVWPNA